MSDRRERSQHRCWLVFLVDRDDTGREEKKRIVADDGDDACERALANAADEDWPTARVAGMSEISNTEED